jgi:hypothetical protein
MTLGQPQSIYTIASSGNISLACLNKRDPSSQPPGQLRVLTMRPLPPSQNAYRIGVGRNRSPLGRSSLTLFRHGTHPQRRQLRLGHTS